MRHPLQRHLLTLFASLVGVVVAGCIEPPAAPVDANNQGLDMTSDLGTSAGDMSSTPDLESPPIDMPEPVDEGGTPDMDTCVPLTEDEYCNNSEQAPLCGGVSVVDGCGGNVYVDCSCEPGFECSTGGSNRLCVECPEPDATMTAIACDDAGATCGKITFMHCGEAVEIMCGSCNLDETCDGNVCECVPENNNDFCARTGAGCGEVTRVDNCGEMRTVNCGLCMENGTCQANNICDNCVAEDDATFCARVQGGNATICGSVTQNDNCGEIRTANCGDCTGGLECAAGNECACPPATCDGSQVCGSVVNECGNVTTCGTCSGTDECIDNACCEDEDPATLCSRLGLECESVTVTNICGKSQTVNCGTCGVDAICTTNVCSCPQPTCAPGNCETVTNSCGSSIDCGACSAGLTCMSGQCVCAPDTDQALCNANNWECGAHMVTDNCGSIRTVDCGGCSDYKNCITNTTNPTTTVCEAIVLTPAAAKASGGFGSSVDIHDDYMIVGAPSLNRADSDPGSAFLYSRDMNMSGRWLTTPDTLTPPSGIHDTHFGYSVAVDGNFALVGAPNFQNKPLTSGDDYGVTVTYKSGSPTSGGEILQGRDNTGEGMSVAILEYPNQTKSSSVSGAPRDTNDVTTVNSHAVTREANANGWIPTSEVTHSAPSTGANMGTSVAMVTKTMAVGLPGLDQVQVFTRPSIGSMWTLQVTLTTPMTGLKPSFGAVVALSDDGTTLAISEVPYSNSTQASENAMFTPKVHIYERVGTGNTWNHIHTIVGAMGSRFGTSLGFIGTGADIHLLIGDPGARSTIVGKVYITARTSAAPYWNGATAILPSPGNPMGDFFGASLATHGRNFAVGAPGAIVSTATKGEVHYFTLWP